MQQERPNHPGPPHGIRSLPARCKAVRRANVPFMGQVGLAIDRIGFAPVFVGAGLALFTVGLAFALMLGRRAGMP
jgi:hypothetical protein